ncbi:hypothetical protein [Vibrio sp. CB1-14]|jgi:hypothetical protein|uniref:Lipoprotein n=1 Tax=Vibrio chaetopteri TaxID=3016528 RepID=A0AAU8BMU5_9VIBR
MKTTKFFALSILAGAITGCGGGSDSSDAGEITSPTTTQVAGTAISTTPLNLSQVCLDFDATTSCSSNYQTQTDTSGKFAFDVSEKDSANLDTAVITVITPSALTQNTPVIFSASTAIQVAEDTIDYQSYLALTSNKNNVIVSPLTSQVADKVTLNGNKQVEDLESVLKRAVSEVKELNEMTDVADEVLFGNYLNASDDITSRIRAKAAQIKQWRQRATEIKKQLKSDPNYSEWKIIKPVVWNVYQYSYHTGEYINRYEEYIYLAKHNQGNLVERYEGKQWLLDTEGNPDLNALLQTYTEDKAWNDDQITERTYWEFDYNQDSVFAFKGEKLAKGSYSKTSSGRHSIVMKELYNEGDPSTEGGWSQKRQYDEYCDLESEFDKIEQSEALDVCVDMYQVREYTNYTDATKGAVNQDLMTEYKKPNGEITLPIAMDYVAYYEEREHYWTLDGGQGTDIRKDWNAINKSGIELDQPPYNQVQSSYLAADGNRSIIDQVPIWRDQASAKESTPATIRLLSQVNPVSWGNFSEAYVYEDAQESDTQKVFSSITVPLDISARYDSNRQADIQLNLPHLSASGAPEEVILQSLVQNKSTGVLTAQTTFKPITPVADIHSLEASFGPTQIMNVEASVDPVTAVHGINRTTQSIKANGTEFSNTVPAFTEGYYGSTWNVTSSDLPENLMELLFNGGSNFEFAESTNINSSALNRIMCWDHDVDRVDMDLMYLNAGDLILTVYCNGNWMNNENEGSLSESPSQYLLKMTTQLDENGNFSATLNHWKYGENIFLDMPNSYTLEFTKL